MSAIDELFQRLEFFSNVFEEEYIKDRPITEIRHNGAANLLRKGLGVILFNIMEDFIRKRSQEILHAISSCSVRFENLPKNLQIACTIGALEVTFNRAKIDKKDSSIDWKKNIREEAGKISKTIGSPFELPQYSLGWNGANINAEEVADILGSFGVDGGWQTITRLSPLIGSAMADACQVYKNALARRHSSAHDPNYSYIYSDLIELPQQIITICGIFDILATSAYRRIKNNPTTCIDVNRIKAGDVKVYHLKTDKGKYKQYDCCKIRAKKIWDDKTAAITEIRARLEYDNYYLITYKDNNSLERWYCQ